jgi:hypothetical protein
MSEISARQLEGVEEIAAMHSSEKDRILGVYRHKVRDG